MRATSRPRNSTPVPFRSPALTAWGVWDRFLRARPDSGFRQSAWWASVTGTASFGVMVRRQGIVIGGGVVHRHRGPGTYAHYALPEGPVLPGIAAPDREVFDALLEAIRHHRHADRRIVTHLRLSPRWNEIPSFLDAFDLRAAPPDPSAGPRHTRLIDLRASETGILARMDPAARGAIAAARQAGVAIVEDDSPRGIAEFAMLAAEVPFAEPWLDLYPRLPSLRTAGHGALLFAEIGGERLAAGLILYYGIRATGIVSDSRHWDPEGLAPSLLHFEGMRRARAHGCESYDLFGVAPPGIGDHPLDAVSTFKARFGGEPVELIPTLDLVFDPAGYELHRALDPP